jgi:hypothetical protein
LTATITTRERRSVTVDLAWEGTGPIESTNNTTVFEGFTGHFQGKRRDAVATGTLVVDGETLVDGSTVEADVIICATGYEMSFPFFDPDDVVLHPDSDHRYPLFKRMIKPGVDHLFFMGLAQSSPTIVNLAEQQSKLLARLLDGTYALPTVAEQEEIMRADEAFHLEQYYAAPRHTIQIDFGRYCVDLHQEIAAGEERAASSAG